jgi:DNA-binding CsgD family transcriptional regulator
MDETLAPKQKIVVELISEGLTRWAIAERMGTNENTVRQYIRQLCEKYDCPMRDLPVAAGLVSADEADEAFTFRPTDSSP